jgi:IS30 family transposase
MDFVEGLPKSEGKDVIMVVIDRFSKYAQFMSLSHPYTAPIMAKIFMDNVYKLHGLPASIASDRDPMFLSKFWNEMFSIQGVNLLYSSAYHPQIDGQTEIVNKCVETYLKCMTGDNPNQ